MVLGAGDGEGLPGPGGAVAAEVEDGSVFLDAGEGQHGEVQILLFREPVQGGIDVPFHQVQVLGGGQDHLGDGDLAAGYIEDLHVRLDKLSGIGVQLRRGGGEKLVSEGVDVQVGNGRQNIGGRPILLRGGGGMKIQGIGENGSQHEPCQIYRDGDLILPEDGGNNGAGGADDLVPELDGILRGEVVDPVVIDDLQDLGLLNGPNGLGELVVVHQYQLLAGGLHDVVPGYVAEQGAVCLGNRVDMVAALEHFSAHILCQLLGPEGHQLRLHDLADAGGEVDVSQGVHAAVAG